MKTFLTIIIALAVFAGFYASAIADDEKDIQGVWKPVKAELGGKDLPPAALMAITLKMEKNSYDVTVEGQGPDKGNWKLDTKAKPKHITITSTEGANKGKTFPTIYDLKGDTLRACYDLSGKAYPTGFKTAKGTLLYLVTYQRQKK